MDSMDKTMKFDFSEEPIEENVKDVLLTVNKSLQEKGYHPINQIVGYLLSGDPAYIPRYKDARNKIRRLDRDELIEELVHFYIEHNKED
ncbi:IreB family regulatory phosphoprotein [Amphibacillus sp. MSJ-3]|uniref:IreB family regulatory phosphoprotein n=1 Tax=Amphibacillus sp. MSJ-3 TaxID=2841505 RepID=UPI001C0F0CEA|nr:IreB family regulatory phosphoprotein [Amphibacillus sp. MSJ-3]MBU5593546.1 IreB family regulatory phosphoprotein [Amphibacillus sp. MSJ-3]